VQCYRGPRALGMDGDVCPVGSGRRTGLRLVSGDVML
jgi:hypothetical protein